jgi:creatinine amidohydrolase/Fe(II)-dependent formamide hydrolase-like protein
MPDLHAGAGETSEMLALRPELVGDERPDCQPPYTREFLDYVPARRLTPTGVWGKASEASAESGRPQIEQTVRAIVAYVRDTFAALEKLESEGE